MKLSPSDYGYYSGILMASAIFSLYQDFQGKEAYIKSVSEPWCPLYISIPLAIILIIFSLILLTIGQFKETPNSKPTKENCLYCGGHGKVKSLDDKEMLCIACDGEKKVDTWS